MTSLVLALLLALGAPPPDLWEDAFDDTAQTMNKMVHGDRQRGHTLHDLAGDADWVVVEVAARRSYEARVGGGTLPWYSPGASVPCLDDCARFARVDAAGQVINQGTGTLLASSAYPNSASDLSVRWVSAVFGIEFLRALQPEGKVSGTYDLSFFDTTLDLPRFNNSGTQVTVLIVRNTTMRVITGQIDFYSGAGPHLHQESIVLPVNATLVLNTSTIPALQGASGAATIAHTAGYGELVGKAVAVEPATGFTFDTPLSPMPY